MSRPHKILQRNEKASFETQFAQQHMLDWFPVKGVVGFFEPFLEVKFFLRENQIYR